MLSSGEAAELFRNSAQSSATVEPTLRRTRDIETEQARWGCVCCNRILVNWKRS
jgi:hypothetical protein